MESKRLMCVLAGEAIRPAPVWLMRQAGRYLPEYRALRAKVGDFLTFCLTPELAVEATLQPVRRFGLDAAILFSDILVVPWAMGYPVAFEEGIGPVLPPLSGRDGLAELDPGRMPEAIEPVLAAVRLVRAALPEEVALIGFAGGPFTLACYLVDGRGHEFSRSRRMVRAEPGVFAALVEHLTEAVILHLEAQAEAGAEVLMLFESWAGLLPPGLFEKYVVTPGAAIRAAIKARFPRVPMIGFPRQAGLMMEAYGRVTGFDCLSFDSTADLSLVARLVPDSMVLQGNLDPWALLGGGTGLKEELAGIARAVGDRAHILNLGHGVLPETPPEHVAEMVRIWRGQA